MISQTYLGLDLGTSELKALLMGADGQVLATTSSPVESAFPQPGWSEQNPQDWWSACVDACRQLKAQAPEAFSAVRSIGLSGHMHGATLLDAEGHVLRPCIMWNDSRSQAECELLHQKLPELERIAGNLAMPGFTAPKIMWVGKHEPDVFAKIAKVLLPKDYLRYLLTGKYVGEMSDAAGTLWLDVAQREWSEAVLEATGLTRENMPDLVEGSAVSAYLSESAAKQLGLDSGLPVAGGAGDNAASAIGIGAILPGDAFLSLGTSGVLFSVTDGHRPNTSDAVHAFCHALPQGWHQMAVMLSAASCLRWVKQLTQFDNEAALIELVQSLNEKQRRQAPIFLPYLSGERTPHNDADASACFLGLRSAHGPADLAYSVLEGVGFGLRDGLMAMQNAGAAVRKAQLVGGGSRSEYWAQLLSNILGITLEVSESASVGAALGAARLAQLALLEGSTADLEKVCAKPEAHRVFEASEEMSGSLSERYALYRQAYQTNKHLFQALQRASCHAGS